MTGSFRPEVHVVGPADVPDVAASLAVAFADDPVLAFLVGDDARRPGVLAGFFANRLVAGVGLDEALTVDGHRAAAVWAPPHGPDDPVADFGPAMAAVSMFVGPEVLAGRLDAMRVVFEAKPHTPHWFLGFVGTRPDARGQGLASALIRHVTDRCDADGVPAYLESSDPGNVPLYERHGFEVTAEIPITGGPVVPVMWREPRPPGQSVR